MTRVRGANRPRFRLLPTVLLTVAILALPTVVYALGRSSSSFAIRHIEVTGTKLVPENRVLRLLKRDFAGHNLFTATSGDVRTTLSPLLYVADVVVDRDFPETLRVNIVEHVPVAYALAGSRWYALDAAGYVICEAAAAGEKSPKKPATSASPSVSPSAPASAAPEATTTDAQVVTGAAGGAAAALDRLVKGPPGVTLKLPRVAVKGRVRQGGVASDPALAQSLQVIAALPGSLRTGLDVVENDGGQLTLRFAGGPVTAWGDTERTLAKTVALRAVLAHYRSAGKVCTALDVSIPDRVLASPVLQ